MGHRCLIQNSSPDDVQRGPAAAERDVARLVSTAFAQDVRAMIPASTLLLVFALFCSDCDGTYVLAYAETDTPKNKDFTRCRWWALELNASMTLLQKHRVTTGVEYRNNLQQVARTFGALRVLDKPFSHREILEAVRRALEA